MDWKKKGNLIIMIKFKVHLNRILNAKVSGLDCEHLPDDKIKLWCLYKLVFHLFINAQIAKYIILIIYILELKY